MGTISCRELRRVEEAAYERGLEDAAKAIENKASLETNSLHCGDNAMTISSVHRFAKHLGEAAKIARALKKRKPDVEKP